MNIALVGCAKTKQRGVHPAKVLYCSTLFRSAFSHAMRTSTRVFILSAKHGLLHPEEVIETYECTLQDMSASARRAWGERVSSQIMKISEIGDALHFFCGRLYRNALTKNLFQRNTIITPLQGLSIGQQLQWYKQNTPT